MKNRVVAWLYSKALRANNFVASVTSVEYGESLKRRLGFTGELFLIHDVYHEDYRCDGAAAAKPRTVFCGGNNGRDWQLIVDLAKAMPDVEFHLVMPGAVYQAHQHELTGNIVAKHNLPKDEFMREMCGCELVALPLDTEAPAGLIVMFQAAANMKYVITADTLTTREYISEGRGSLVARSVEKWKEEISERLLSLPENEKASRRLLNFLQAECTEQQFVQGVEKMIKSI